MALIKQLYSGISQNKVFYIDLKDILLLYKNIILQKDEKILFSCSFDKTIIQWNTQNQNIIHRFEGHASAVSKIILS